MGQDASCVVREGFLEEDACGRGGAGPGRSRSQCWQCGPHRGPCWEKVSPDGGPDGELSPGTLGAGGGRSPRASQEKACCTAGGREDSPSSCSQPGSQWVSQGRGDFPRAAQQSPTEQGA